MTVARDLETFAAALENLAAGRGTTGASGIRATIERLEEGDRRRWGNSCRMGPSIHAIR